MADTASDPTGDFLASYGGPQLADLDVVSFSVNRVGTDFVISAAMAGAIGTSDGSYVIGVDRGGGAAPFTTFGRGGILFDAAIVLQQDATGVVTLLPGGSTGLAPGSVSISDSTISAIIPLALLPSTGFDPAQFGFSFWSRTTTTSGNAAIADFAPDNSSIKATAAVPEPATWAILLLGFGAAGSALRRRRASVTAVATIAS